MGFATPPQRTSPGRLGVTSGRITHILARRRVINQKISYIRGNRGVASGLSTANGEIRRLPGVRNLARSAATDAAGSPPRVGFRSGSNPIPDPGARVPRTVGSIDPGGCISRNPQGREHRRRRPDSDKSLQSRYSEEQFTFPVGSLAIRFSPPRGRWTGSCVEDCT
jgi:hypothetical protein